MKMPSSSSSALIDSSAGGDVMMGGASTPKKTPASANSDLQRKPVVHLMLSFRQICLVTVSLPLCGIVVCFITAYIFQPDEIHETHCRVYNIIPSISAITGVSPQRYLWRICVAFHLGPRLLIAALYKSYYASLLELLPTVQAQQGGKLLALCYWLNLVEVGALCGVTYISNIENYPVHEKIFIIFMLCSLSHMLATLKLYNLVHPVMSADERVSYIIKKFLFLTSIVCTVGLLLFFAEHRLLCHDMAFSWFALCEYIIASANMAFHVMVVLDFPTEQLIIARGLQLSVVSSARNTNDQSSAAFNNYKSK